MGPAHEVEVEGYMISAYCWGWGDGRSIAFWGWAWSEDSAAVETRPFVPTIGAGRVLSQVRTADRGVPVSVIERTGAGACTGGLWCKAVHEGAAARSAATDKSVENRIAAPGAEARCTVLDGAFVYRTVFNNGVKKSCGRQETAKVVKSGPGDRK